MNSGEVSALIEDHIKTKHDSKTHGKCLNKKNMSPICPTLTTPSPEQRMLKEGLEATDIKYLTFATGGSVTSVSVHQTFLVASSLSKYQQ